MSWWLILIFLVPTSIPSNGELAKLECPEICQCYYFRIHWVADCSDSNLTDIPFEELSRNVYILDLNGNFIKTISLFPADFKLTRIHLAYNLIMEVKKDSLSKLNHIIDADFAHNRIQRIDPYTFESKAGFLTLKLHDNPLVRVDGPFLFSNTLLYLDVSSCNLNYLNDIFFDQMPSLSSLDLSNNPINVIKNSPFYPLRNLATLKMNECSLSFLDKSVFMTQINLKTLKLARNKFKNIAWPALLGPLGRLEHLDLRKSGLVNIQEGAFGNLTYLRTLLLSENNLGGFVVSTAIGQNLIQLETLDMSYCNLTHPLSENAFVNTVSLKALSLSGNKFLSYDLLLALKPLIKLQKLSLSDCNLRVLPEILEKFQSLTELDISTNPFKNELVLHFLAPLTTLEYLNMGYSNLSYITPGTFSLMTFLKRLILSGNKFTSLEAGLFDNFNRLESLELSSCGVSRPINARAFFNNFTYTGIRELKLASCPLIVRSSESLLPKQFFRLEILDLSNCSLKYLPPNAFANTKNIMKLSLAGNYFSSPEDLFFLKQLPFLQDIDLSFNNFSRFTYKAVSGSPNLQKLKLVGNPWKCACSLVELWDWVRSEKKNFNILEGGTAAIKDITAGKTKRNRLLSCEYETSKLLHSTNSTLISRSVHKELPQIANASANKTWAKFVRESGCKTVVSLKRSKRTSQNLTIEEVLLAEAKHVPNEWGQTLIYVSVFYAGVIFGLFLFKLWLNCKEKKLLTNTTHTQLKNS